MSDKSPHSTLDKTPYVTLIQQLDIQEVKHLD